MVEMDAYPPGFPPAEAQVPVALPGGFGVVGSAQSAYVQPLTSLPNAVFVVAPDWTGSVKAYSRTCS